MRIPLGIMAAAMLAAPLAASGAAPVSFERPGLAAPATLGVTLPGEKPDGAFPQNYTADGRNISPPLTWTRGPAQTKSYAVVMEDPDAPGAGPAVHWLVYNIPPTVLTLPKGMRNTPTPSTPLGASQGWNFHGGVGYSGPRPPPGDPPHHYHVQVFALDRTLRTKPGARLDPVVDAMTSHVLARGEVVLTYQHAAPAAPKAGA